MASYTLTNTAWGELWCSVDEGTQKIRATCKRCGLITAGEIPLGQSPFSFRPIHRDTCQFAPPPPPVLDIERSLVELEPPPAPEPVPPPVDESRNWQYWIYAAAAAGSAFAAGAWFL